MSCSFWLKYAPNRLSADPTGGAYRAPQAVFRGPTSKGGEGGGKGGEEREGRSSSFALGRKRKVGASGSQHSINFLMGTL